jgi:hypothetical protein
MEFWYQFDKTFLPTQQTEQEILEAYFSTEAPDGARVRWRKHRKAGTYPAGFKTEAQTMSAPTLFLFRRQKQVMDAHFPDPGDLQRAYEDFGQGVLFDDRRSPGYKLHTMDAGNDYVAQPFIGYHRWHAFIREAEACGADKSFCLFWNRLIGLAWAIQSEVRPKQDEKPPTGDRSQKLPEHRTRWMKMSVDDLDAAFDEYPFPPSA